MTQEVTQEATTPAPVPTAAAVLVGGDGVENTGKWGPEEGTECLTVCVVMVVGLLHHIQNLGTPPVSN